MNALATGTCVGKTRDRRPCTSPATAVIDTPADVPDAMHAASVMNVCGVHRIAFDETAATHGPRAATMRVLTGSRA